MSKNSKLAEPQAGEYSLMQLSALFKVERRSLSERLQLAQTPFRDGPRNAKLYKLSDIWTSLVKMQAQTPVESSTETQLKAEQLKMISAKRERAELDLEIKKGEYIATSEALKVISQEYSIIRAQLRALPSRLAKHLANESDPAKAFEMLYSSIEETLSELQADAQNEVEQQELDETAQDQTDDQV